MLVQAFSGNLSDYSTVDLNQGLSVCKIQAPEVKESIWGYIPVLEHRLSSCGTFVVECKFHSRKSHVPGCN